MHVFQGVWVRNREYLLMSPGAYFYVAAALFVLYWVLSILWTIRDVASRTNNVFWQIMAVVLVTILTPILGLPIYLFLRPARSKRDRIAWRESIIAQVAACPACNHKNPLHHDFCTQCGQQMTVKCKECKNNYQWIYDYCPQCGWPNVE